MKKKRSKSDTVHITEKQLLTLAGDIYFERGVDYYQNGAVVWLDAKPQDITARVRGSTDVSYLVRYWLHRNQLQWGCACPLGVDGAFCKHLVAAGLTWINDNDDAPHMESDVEAVIADLRTALVSFDREQLLEMMVERAIWDDSFIAELYLLARSNKIINKNN